MRKQWNCETYKLLGDIRKKQGQTKLAFENYFHAMEYEPHSYIKTELSRIFLEDLYKGSRRAGFFAKRTDATEFLDAWLGKYKSQKDLEKLWREYCNYLQI